MTLDDWIQQASVAGAAKPTGTAAIYYRIGNQLPVQVLTPFFQMTTEPKSLVLWFYDPSVEPVQFVLFLAIENIYIGPGEYKGNVNDVHVGMGAPLEGAVQNPTWTAGDATASDLTTYFVPGGSELIGTFSVQGLVPGPIFGPPESPPPGLPTAEVLFCFFESEPNENEVDN